MTKPPRGLGAELSAIEKNKKFNQSDSAFEAPKTFAYF